MISPRIHISTNVREGGRLFSVPLAGGAPREWVEQAWAADAGPLPGDFAVVVGKWGGRLRLEWPLGHTLLEGRDLFRSPRIRGNQLAIFRDGESRFTAIDLQGHTRTLLKHAGRLEILDVDPSGRALAVHHVFQRQTFSDDPVRTLLLVPTGTGTPRRIPIPEFSGYDTRAELLPDGKSALLWGASKGGPFAWHRLDLASGTSTRITPDGSNFFLFQTVPSPDAQWLEFNTADGHYISRTDGKDFHPVKGIDRRDAVAGWTEDSKKLVLFDRNRLPAPVIYLDPATGDRTPAMTLSPPDPVGIPGLQGLQVSKNGKFYAYNVVRKLSSLYLVEGLK